jgi:hypothetical protein
MAGWQFRPAKQIQRLIAVDAMRKLSVFRPLPEYRYVGFGGFEFIDFDLVKRALDVRRMVSIENELTLDRINFNRPSPDIEVEYGHSNEILPGLALDEPSIVWMDYCGPVRFDVLQDMLLLGERMLPGSMLLITVNASVATDGKRLSTLQGRVGVDRVPVDVSAEKHLDGWQTAEVQRRVLLEELRRGLGQRSDSARFEQILNVQYRDTQRMQTIGGVVIDPGTEAPFRSAEYRLLPYVRPGSETLRIKVPVLTAREVLNLESRSQLGAPVPSFSWLKQVEADSFADLHRWYPPVPAPM